MGILEQDANKTVSGDTSVLQLMEARRISGSKPLERKDERHVALLVGSGGMRGAMDAGAIVAIQEMGLTGTIDSIIGPSSGALVGAYVGSGQAKLGTRMFPEDLSGKQFVDTGFMNSHILLPWMFARQEITGRDGITYQPAPMDTRYLVNDVINGSKQYDLDAQKKSGIPLTIVTTDVATLTPRYHTGPWTPEKFSTAVEASVHIPGIAGAPQNGEYDGGFSDPFPIRKAIEDGATDIIIIANQHPKKLDDLNMFSKWAVGTSGNKDNPNYSNKFYERYADLKKLGETTFQEGMLRIGNKSARIVVIHPPEDLLTPNGLTTGADELRQLAAMGYDQFAKSYTSTNNLSLQKVPAFTLDGGERPMAAPPLDLSNSPAITAKAPAPVAPPKPGFGLAPAMP